MPEATAEISLFDWLVFSELSFSRLHQWNKKEIRMSVSREQTRSSINARNQTLAWNYMWRITSYFLKLLYGDYIFHAMSHLIYSFVYQTVNFYWLIDWLMSIRSLSLTKILQDYSFKFVCTTARFILNPNILASHQYSLTNTVLSITWS